MQINQDIMKSKYLNHIYQQWHISSTHFPDFLTEITLDEKINHEVFVDSALNDFKAHFHSFSQRIPFGRKNWRIKTLSLVHNVLATENIIGIHSVLKDEDLQRIQNEIGEFLSKAREFAKELTFSDIGQAARNYMVYMMFKEMNHINTGFSEACFGYSMLYPFTDNYIDNTNLSSAEKVTYNNIIREKIKGEPVNTESSHERKTCKLLDFIDANYNRITDNSIHTLLLMMLEAQEISMTQQKKNNLSEADRLHISIYKGGISVLIDRYLINMALTEEDIIFYLSFGFFLQLADDLLDISEDIKSGSQTIFTLDTSREHLENLINKLFNYVHCLFNNYKSRNEKFKNFILSNCYLLILYGVSENRDSLSPTYLKVLEHYFPVRFMFLENIKNSLKQLNYAESQDTYMKILDEILIYYANPKGKN